MSTSSSSSLYSNTSLEQHFIEKLARYTDADPLTKLELFKNFSSIFNEHTSPIINPGLIFSYILDHYLIVDNNDEQNGILLNELTGYTSSFIKKTYGPIKDQLSKKDYNEHQKKLISRICKNFDTHSVPALRANVQALGAAIRFTHDKRVVIQALITHGFLTPSMSVRNAIIRYFRTYLDRRYLQPEEEVFKIVVSSLGTVLTFPESKVLAKKLLIVLMTYIGEPNFVDHLNYCEPDIQQLMIKELDIADMLELDGSGSDSSSTDDIEPVQITKAASQVSNFSAAGEPLKSSPESKSEALSMFSPPKEEEKVETSSVNKFNLIHRKVFHNILHTDSRVQNRAMNQLHQVLQDPVKRKVLENLTRPEVKEFIDLLQVPLQSSHSPTSKLGMDCLSILIDKLPSELVTCEASINSVISHLLKNLKDLSSEPEKRSSIYRLLALLSEKNDEYANIIVTRAVSSINNESKLKETNLKLSSFQVIESFLNAIATSCLVITDPELSKVNLNIIAQLADWDREDVWLICVEILVIIEKVDKTSLGMGSKKLWDRLESRLEIIEETPPILDNDFTVKIPRSEVVDRAKRKAKSLDFINFGGNTRPSDTTSSNQSSNESLVTLDPQ